MKICWKRVNRIGFLGAAALIAYGFLAEPLAAVLGGIMILTDITVYLTGLW